MNLEEQENSRRSSYEETLYLRRERAKAARAQLCIRLEQSQIRVEKAEDYRRILNLMAAHVHCCMNQDYLHELDTYWSGRDDIAYANGDLAYIGQKAVRAYYAGRPKEPGYLNMNLIGTPYVEIAGDRNKAQGIWMAHSFQSQTEEDGTLKSQGVLSRYAADFIRENGQWKLWRRRNYADVVFEEAPMSMLGLPAGKNGKLPKPMVENQRPTVLTRLDAPDTAFSKSAVPTGVPPIPASYETWSLQTSCVRKVEG